MKKIYRGMAAIATALLLFCFVQVDVQAKEAGNIETGVFAESVDLSGMTAKEAKAAIEEYVASLSEVEITFVTTDGNTVTATAGQLGVQWTNPEIVDEAVHIGTQGNIVQRYKALADLKHTNKVFDIALGVDQELVKAFVEEECTKHDIPVKNCSLTRVDGVFEVVGGEAGYGVNVETSVPKVVDFIQNEWNHEAASIELNVETIEPIGSAQELAQVKDLLGTSTTDYSTSGSSRSANVANGCNLINGITLYPGEEFSSYDTITPFTTENGYYLAGSYLNGQVVDSIGGGACQVTTTLYNAVLEAELEVTERHNHSMIVTYVEPSADAAIAESSGKDFKFVNSSEYPIYIEGITTPDKKITFNIYGVETRAANRDVRYESVILSTTYPETEAVYADASQPVGYVSPVQSAHIGYKAQLWKIVTVDGVEQSRTQINSSTYKVSPRSITVGTATDNPDLYNQIMTAVATSSVDYAASVANAIATGTQVPPAPQPPAQDPAQQTMSGAVQQPVPQTMQPEQQVGVVPPI